MRLRDLPRQKLGCEMKSGRLPLAVSVAVALVLPAFCQQQTVARLSRESRADIPRTEVGGSGKAKSTSLALRDSSLSRAAADALFVKSDTQRARVLAERALRHDAQDAEALFVRMELAELEADYATALDNAVRLCDAGEYAPDDPRVRLAAVRVREAAGNTPEFRRAIPSVRALVENTDLASIDLNLALLNASMDGAPGLDSFALARSAGILTDWRIVGPIGSHPLLDLGPQPISPADDLSQALYAGRAVENFQFPDGWIRLPDYLPRHGVFYAAGRFASLTSEIRHVRVDAAGVFEIYVDGQRVLRTDAARQRDSASFEVMPGPHRVLLKFAASAAPLRVAVSHDAQLPRAALRARLSSQEAVYLLAAEHYADDDFAAAAKRIEAEPASEHSPSLQFLRAQALAKSVLASQDPAATWQQLQSEFPQTRVAADPESWWARRMAEHPSCDVLRGALEFYQSRRLQAERDATQQRLDGCAPESLAYAQSLAQDGRHEEAAQALRRLLAGAPLNREARVMLIRELQLAGDDEAAQRAAADWLRVAPNAPSYHRLAAAADLADGQPPGANAEFYQPYRRDAAPVVRETSEEESQAGSIMVLDDQVAIARPDGSVSLYVHTARRLVLANTVQGVALARVPAGAQVLTLRVLHPDGTASQLEGASQANSSLAAVPGDTIDAEYVLHFTGDGGIPEHAEAFQFVFGNFDEPVLNARFVVLTPADHGDGGVVIATGGPPAMRAKVRNGMLERAWEKNAPEVESQSQSEDEPLAGGIGLAVVRVVEQDNGWSVPSKAEHQRRIETIHPGPRPEDS